MQGFTVVDLVILVVYLAAVLFAGLHFAKKEMKGKEYFKGDGTVPWWVTSVSIFATLLSPISFLSLAGNSYAGTWIMWFAQLGMLQGSVLLIGVTFALIFLLAHLDGGFGAIAHALTTEHKFLAVDQPIFNANIFKDSVFIMIVGAGFNTMASYVSSQDIVQRFTTTTDTKKLNKMMLANGGLSIFIATVFYLIGTGLYVFYQQNTLPPAAAQDQIFASYIAFELPVGITGLLLAAIYAAAQSTLSTGLNSVASSWTLDIQARLSKKELSFEKQTKIGQYVSLIVGIFAIVVAMVLANGGVKSAYEWFNGFMGLVLGILIGTFILGAFTKVANTFGAVCAFIVASGVMVYIKYFVPADHVSIWSYSIISIVVSLVIGIPASIIWRKAKGDNSVPAPNTTIYKN